MNQRLQSALVKAVLGVCAAALFDLVMWQKSRSDAMDQGRPVPGFKWATAWPRYFSAAIAGFLSEFSDLLPTGAQLPQVA